MMPTKRIRGLYAITPDTPDTARLLAATAAVLAGGAQVLQYRSKSSDPDLKAHQAAALAGLCRDQGAVFIINDDWQLAREVGADGVHVGENDLPLTALRTLCPDLLIGVSCYNVLDLAVAAARDGADYVAFGSFFPSRTKPFARRADVALLEEARARLECPIVTIGGITRANAAPLVVAGADAVAVISDLYEADCPEQAAAAFAALFSPREDTP